MLPPIHILLWKGKTECNKNAISIQFRLKSAWKYVYLAHQIQNFLRQEGAGPLQPLNCRSMNFDGKATIIVYGSAQTHSLMKRRAFPFRPPKIIYFCKFSLKRAWNYAYLARKLQHFLRKGDAALLQPPKWYVRPTYKFWQKRDWNCAFVVPLIHILLWKGGLPPCDNQKSNISVN